MPFLRRWRLHPFFRDIGLTTATEFAILVTNLVLVSLFGRLLGPIALAEYLLVRRVASGLQPSAQLGLGVALPRYVAHATVKSTDDRETYFLAGMICLMVFSVVLGAAFILKRQLFARWMFGDAQMANLAIALSFLLLGWAAQVAVYGYYRGRLLMERANLLQLCTMVVAPFVVIAVLFRTHSVPFIIGAMGAMIFLCSLLFAVPILRPFINSKPAKLVPYGIELLRYGIVRVPGSIGASALFVVGPVVAAHYVPIATVSYLLIGLSILSTVGYCGAPLGVVILSKATMMLAQNRQAEIQTYLRSLVSAVVELSLYVCIQLFVFADVLIHAWVGPRFLGGVDVVRLLIAGIPFYLFIIALRSVVDAVTWKPYNTRNVLTSLALFLAIIAIATRVTSGLHLLESFAAAVVAGLVVLAWLTRQVVEHLYNLRLSWKGSYSSIAFSLLLGGVAVLSRVLWRASMGPVKMVVLELCFAALFIGVLAKRGSPWMVHLRDKALAPR